MTFCPHGEKTTRTDTYVSRNPSTPCPPVRPPATVITLSQSKLAGNLGWGKKWRSCSKFLISRSASKVWVKIKAALQRGTIEEGVQTTLWALGLFHNETLCAFEAHFSWEPAKLSSKGVTLKDFLHKCLAVFLFETDLLEVRLYSSMIFCYRVNASYQVHYAPPHVNVSSAMHEMETATTAADNAESEDSVFLNSLQRRECESV